MSLTDKQKFDLNKMCPAAGDSNLGDMVNRFNEAIPGTARFNFGGGNYIAIESGDMNFYLANTLEFYVDEYGGHNA